MSTPWVMPVPSLQKSEAVLASELFVKGALASNDGSHDWHHIERVTTPHRRTYARLFVVALTFLASRCTAPGT
jgi:hypothetical protein